MFKRWGNPIFSFTFFLIPKEIPWWFLIGLFIKKLMKNKNKNLQNVIVIQIYDKMKI
jgi:hypothetical protein